MKTLEFLFIRLLLKPRFWKRMILAVLIVSIGLSVSPLRDAISADPMLALQPRQSQRLSDRKGKTFFHWPEYGNPATTSPDGLSKHLVNAVIAREDKRFMSHCGADPFGTIRAFITNIKELPKSVMAFKKPRIVQGGSTVTMQLVELTYDRPETGLIERLQAKVFEMVMAFRIERAARKQTGERRKAKLLIMARYLDRIPFGSQGTGIQEAADRTFGKPLVALNLGESAYLAGLIRAPSANSVYRNEENARAARDAVVRNMLKLGMITERQAKEAKFYARDKPKTQKRRGDGFTSEAVRSELRLLQDAGLVSRDLLNHPSLEIQASLDVGLQDTAHALLLRHLTGIENTPGFTNSTGKPLNGCVIALDHATGTVLACVGGRDFDVGQVNLATQGSRSLASAVKVFDYAAYMEATGLGIESRLSNAALSSKEAGAYRGKMDPREVLPVGTYPMWVGIKDSSNRMAVRAGVLAGNYHWSRVMREMNLIKGVAPADTSLFLGSGSVHPIDAAAAYSCIARRGSHISPRFIKNIIVEGKVVYSLRPASRSVLSPRVCVELTKGLREVLRGGTTASHGGKELARRFALAGKTGTSDNCADAWFCGYGSDVTVVVWIGFPDGSRTILPGGSGGSVAFPLWKDVIEELARRGYAFKPLPDLRKSSAKPVQPDLAVRR